MIKIPTNHRRHIPLHRTHHRLTGGVMDDRTRRRGIGHVMSRLTRGALGDPTRRALGDITTLLNRRRGIETSTVIGQ